MAHNIPLQILDEYAKRISSNLANMLYENKCNRKYVKDLYEDMCYLDDDSFSIYLNDYTLDEAESSVSKALVKYVNKHGLQYNVVSDGVYFYTPSETNYVNLLENLVSDGFDVDSLKSAVDDQKTIDFLEKLQVKYNG